MRRLSRPMVPQRRRVFLGCEGESERGYGARLQQLLNAEGISVHLDLVLLQPGSGDPLELVKKAKRHIETDRTRRVPYAVRALLLDADRREGDPIRDRQATALATAATLHLIWQEPCHEALLLRHLKGCENLRPSASAQAIAELKRRRPDYIKGMSAARLADWIGADEVRRAMRVEGLLAAFLTAIGFT